MDREEGEAKQNESQEIRCRPMSSEKFLRRYYEARQAPY